MKSCIVDVSKYVQKAVYICLVVFLDEYVWLSVYGESTNFRLELIEPSAREFAA